MKVNATITSALETRITSQKNQSIDLNKWIFNNIKINSSDSVLELCCGIGAQTIYFDKYIDSGSLVCVDINQESLNKAKSIVKNKKINFVKSEIDQTQNYLKKRFDLIFSAYGFYYSNDPVELHKKLHSNLNENGKFIMVGPTIGNNLQLYNIVRELKCEIPDKVLDASEFFLLRFVPIFMEFYKDVKVIKTINEINYSDHQSLLEYWKNTTFYTKGYDDKFISLCKRYFKKKITINKSIAYLEGSL